MSAKTTKMSSNSARRFASDVVARASRLRRGGWRVRPACAISLKEADLFFIQNSRAPFQILKRGAAVFLH